MNEGKVEEHIENILYYFEKYHYENMILDDNEAKFIHDYIKKLKQENQQLKEQLQQKEDIIKEAREELQRGITFCQNDSQGMYDKCNIAINREKKILEILNEASNKEENHE